MEIKQGSQNIVLFIKPRVNGQVIAMDVWANLYGSTPAAGTFTLQSITADKTASQSLVSSSIDADGMFFTLPASMFADAQRTWTNSLNFTFGSIIDSSLYNFDIKVTKADSVNSR